MKVLRIFCLFAALTATFAIAQPENPQIRKEVQAVYTKWDRLVAKADIEGMLALLAADFVSIDVEGNVHNRVEVAKMFQTFKDVRDARSKIRVDHVYWDEQEAVAWVTMEASFLIKQGGKWERMTFAGKFAETLRKGPSGWKFVCSQELPDEKSD